MKRTQLNVSIDPKLLEKIKESARISGKSLVGFVSDCFVNQIENLPVESIDSRFQTIEQRLHLQIEARFARVFYLWRACF